jgi:hypothetical protein
MIKRKQNVAPLDSRGKRAHHHHPKKATRIFGIDKVLTLLFGDEALSEFRRR